MDKKQLVKSSEYYNEIEKDYIAACLADDSQIIVYDMNGERVERCTTFISRIADDGRIYVKKLDDEGRPTGPEYEAKSGYYISGCEYAELEI